MTGYTVLLGRERLEKDQYAALKARDVGEAPKVWDITCIQAVKGDTKRHVQPRDRRDGGPRFHHHSGKHSRGKAWEGLDLVEVAGVQSTLKGSIRGPKE